MIITLLGTGDTVGTPKIGCTCPTCIDALDEKSKSRRTRFSILIESEKGKILIDTSPDMRHQLLKNGVFKIDGVIWTHSHYDHFTGFGDFYRVQNDTNVYGLRGTLDRILKYLDFMTFMRNNVELYKPFKLIGLDFMLFKVNHPPIKDSAGVCVLDGEKKLIITGDTRNDIPNESLEVMGGADLMIADAIIPPNFKVKKHMDSDEAIELAKKLGAKKLILTHLSHLYPPHDVASKNLPLGYDNMKIEL